MNSAKTVYAQPELEGESTDTAYQRFLSNLTITEQMILPHYQDTKNDILDGKGCSRISLIRTVMDGNFMH